MKERWYDSNNGRYSSMLYIENSLVWHKRLYHLKSSFTCHYRIGWGTCQIMRGNCTLELKPYLLTKKKPIIHDTTTTTGLKMSKCVTNHVILGVTTHITLHNSSVVFLGSRYHLSIVLVNSRIPCWWGALKLCTMNHSVNIYEIIRVFRWQSFSLKIDHLVAA